MNDMESKVRRVLASVGDAIPDLPAPTEPACVPARDRRRARAGGRRIAVIAAVGIGFSTVGLGGAVAGKVLHVKWFDPTPGTFNPLPQTERLVVTTTNPDGKAVELWTTDAAGTEEDAVGNVEKGYCLAFVLPDQQERTAAQPVGGCSGDVGTVWWDRFLGSGVALGDNGETEALLAYRVGAAERVVLIEPDGTRLELGVNEGWTVARVEGRNQGQVEFVGYDRAGKEIARKSIELPTPGFTEP